MKKLIESITQTCTASDSLSAQPETLLNIIIQQKKKININIIVFACERFNEIVDPLKSVLRDTIWQRMYAVFIALISLLLRSLSLDITY